MDDVRIARRGGGVVEAFPHDSPEIRHNVFTGSTDMYRREGFAEVTRLSESKLLMRKRVEALA